MPMKSSRPDAPARSSPRDAWHREWHRLYDELARQHVLLRVALDSVGDAVITTDHAERVTWLNPVAERITGWRMAEAIGQRLADVFRIAPAAGLASAQEMASPSWRERARGDLPRQSVLIARHGTERGVEHSEAPVRNQAGEVIGSVLVFRDVAEQRRLSEEIAYRATHDPLTGLLNRSEFESAVQQRINRASRERSEHALLYIDLDQFKLVNDACGHRVGDQLLQQVGRIFQAQARPGDTVARLGGDEFGILLDNCPLAHARELADRLCASMDTFRFLHEERRFRIGASVGLVPIDRDSYDLANVLQAADASCYAAKEAGRNRVHVWLDTDKALHARRGDMQWAARLEHALDDRRLVLYGQRIVPIDDDLQAHAKTTQIEVLVRLIERDGTIVLPGAFLPAAERFQIAYRIDRRVLRLAIEALATFAHAAPRSILHVNLSGQSIGDRAFHREALELLDSAGPQISRRLCFEITETAAITNLADATAFIDQVRQRGCGVALDDFGSGTSSFGYLKSLKIDCLKIDGQFIRNIGEDRLDEVAVQCFVDVARAIDVRTVAEFVDKPQVLERLRTLGVDYAQGHLIHEPEPLWDIFGRLAVEGG